MLGEAEQHGQVVILLDGCLDFKVESLLCRQENIIEWTTVGLEDGKLMNAGMKQRL